MWELFEHMQKIKFQKAGMANPVLRSRDGTWDLATLYWVDRFVDRAEKAKGYYRSGNRWYVRRLPGSGFRTEADARIAYRELITGRKSI